MAAIAGVNLATHPANPLWYHAALVAFALPATLAGGVLGRSPQPRHAEPGTAPDWGRT